MTSPTDPERWKHGGVLFDGVSHQLPDIDPGETAEWLDAFDDVVDDHGRTRARYLLMRVLERAGQKHVDFPGHRLDPLRQHHPLRRGAGLPRRRVPRAPDPGLHPVERRGDGGPGQRPLRGHRRPPVHLRQLGLPLRGGVQPLLPGQGRRGARATRSTSRATPPPASTPGPSSRAGCRRSSSTTSGSRWAADGLSSYPHPRLMPDFWEFPTVSMGLGPLNAIAQAHVSPLPPRPRAGRHLGQPGLGLRRRRRVRRARDHRRPRHGRAGAPRQPHLRGQLQPPAARRPGPRQRQGHPGVRGPLPRRRLERDQGDLGPHLGRAAGQGRRRGPPQQDELDGRRRVPEVRHRVGRLHPGALLRTRPPAGRRWSPTSPTRSSSRSPAAATTTASSTPPTRRPPSTSARRPPSWPRRSRAGRSGPEIEARNATHQIKKMTKAQLRDPPRPALPPRGDPRARPRRRPAPLLPAGPGLAGRAVPGRAAAGPRRAAPQPGGAGPSPCPPPAAAPSPTSWPGPAARRCPPPWPSPGCSGRWSAIPAIGERIVPIVSDEARTFGLESLISEVQIYAPDGQRYTPVDAGLALHYAESAIGPGPRGGHHRGRGDGHLHRRRHLVRHLGRADDPLLPLLLDVRLPAGGRPAVGPRRQPGPRVPARLHRRPDHAQRRGPPAPGRPLAAAGLGRTRPSPPTTPPSPTRWPPSSRTGSGG